MAPLPAPLPPPSAVRALVAAVARPGPVTREAGRLAADAARILRGTDEHAPGRADKRFADPTWAQHPLYRRLAQGYLATGSALTRLIDSYEADGADWREVERARFAAQAATSLLSPTNTLLGNPAALKRAFETGGGSLVRGARNLVHDVRHNGGMPQQTDRSAFAVGTDLAMSPGWVVDRDDVAEVLQFSPTTAEVHRRPLVIVPPPIGRYYFLDLRPGRSFVEHAVSQGFQVFLVSWRNPTRAQSDWDLDTYAARVVSAVETAKQVTGSPDVSTLGFCAGGILAAGVLNHLAATGDSSVHSAGFAVTLLDFDSPAPLGAFSSPPLLHLAARSSRRAGVITARSLGAVFSWMRPDDLVFNYVVGQWLLGERPPVFDILAWNADGTNLPARLHEQFLDVFGQNELARPGALTVLGTPVDLGTVEVPTFVTGAVTDHLTPWTGCYRTTELLSGPTTFVLSNAGHIASLVNPPGNPKASYSAGGELGRGAEHWRETATRHTGSWWEAWAGWMRERSGDLVAAPQEPGSSAFPALDPAPGRYVVDRA